MKNDEKIIILLKIILILPFFLINTLLKLFKAIQRKKYSPLILVEIYLLLTVILFYFGPINYPQVSTFKTVSLIILYNFFFILGYSLADRRFVLYNKNFNLPFTRIRSILILGGITSIFFSLMSFIGYSNTLNPTVIFRDLQVGISNPGEAYIRNLQMEKESRLITQLMTLLSPLTYLTLPLGMFFYKKLKMLDKILLVLVGILEILTFIIKGTNFGIFKVGIILLVVFLINKNAKKVSLTTKIITSFVVFYFLYSISSRMQLTTIPYTVFDIEVNKEHFLFEVLPISLSVPLMLGISYISQGYYALSLTSLYDFQPTYGFGSGRFLISKAQSIFHVDMWERTYQYKMEFLWDSRVNWHTIYVWIANDVGLYGVSVVIGIIGFFFCLVLKDAKENGSISAVILLPLYVIMITFIPANNIVFDNPLMCVPFIFFNLVWIFSKSWRVKI